MNNTKRIGDGQMTCVLKWHRINQLITACIYALFIPFLIIYILNNTEPNFNWEYFELTNLMRVMTIFFILRVMSSLVTKVKIGKWESENEIKLTDKQLINLL